MWLADGNDPPKCMKMYVNTFACPHTDAEYYHGFYWSSHIMDIIIWSAGIVFGVKLYRKKQTILQKTIHHYGRSYCTSGVADFFYWSF